MPSPRRFLTHPGTRAALILPLLAALLPAPAAASAPVRASYFYSYMTPDHLDSLARAGFNRAIIKCIDDSLLSRGRTEYQGFLARAPSGVPRAGNSGVRQKRSVQSSPSPTGTPRASK